MPQRHFLAVLAILTIISAHTYAQDSFINPVKAKVKLGLMLEGLTPDMYEIDTTTIAAPDLTVETEVVEAWRQWTVVENYAFGKDRGTLSMITDLNALHPFFRDKVKELMIQCEKKGIQLAVVETFRTHAKQNEYKGMGKNYTNSAGGRSKHQYGLAVDVVPIINGKAVWNNTALWRKVGVTGEKLGLRWGGRWKRPYDPAHFEWTGGLTSTHLAAGTLPTIPVEKYPCIEEDVEMLRKFWSEWESIQGATTRR